MRAIKGARSFRPVGLSGSRTETSRYGDCMDTSSAWQDELVVGSRNKKVRLVGLEYVVLPTTFSSMIHRSLFGRGVDFQAS